MKQATMFAFMLKSIGLMSVCSIAVCYAAIEEYPCKEKESLECRQCDVDLREKDANGKVKNEDPESVTKGDASKECMSGTCKFVCCPEPNDNLKYICQFTTYRNMKNIVYKATSKCALRINCPNIHQFPAARVLKKCVYLYDKAAVKSIDDLGKEKGIKEVKELQKRVITRVFKALKIPEKAIIGTYPLIDKVVDFDRIIKSLKQHTFHKCTVKTKPILPSSSTKLPTTPETPKGTSDCENPAEDLKTFKDDFNVTIMPGEVSAAALLNTGVEVSESQNISIRPYSFEGRFKLRSMVFSVQNADEVNVTLVCHGNHVIRIRIEKPTESSDIVLDVNDDRLPDSIFNIVFEVQLQFIQSNKEIPIQLGGVCGYGCYKNKSCQDKLTPNRPIRLGSTEIQSCDELVSNYKVLCREYGLPDGKCCRSCNLVGGHDCVDDLHTFKVNSTDLSCSAYVDQDKCRCMDEEINKTCCQSCSNVDLFEEGCLCKNQLTAENPALISVKVSKRKSVNVTVTSCKEIVEHYTQYCAEDKLGGLRNRCCLECANVDIRCFDDPLWKGTIKSGKTKCKKCTCKQILKKGHDLMKKACSKNIKGTKRVRAKDACCFHCKQFIFTLEDVQTFLGLY